MPLIQIPGSPWTRQPQKPVKPLDSRVGNAWHCGLATEAFAFDLCGGIDLPYSLGVANATEHGTGNKTPNTASLNVSAYTGTGLSLPSFSTKTIVVVIDFVVGSSNGPQGVFQLSSTTSAGLAVIFRTTPQKFCFVVNNVEIQGTLDTVPGRKIIVAKYNYPNMELWVNGVLQASGTAAPASVADQTSVSIGGGIAASTVASCTSLNGTSILAYTLDWYPSADETRALSENPWQIFAPQPRTIFIPAAGGGPTTYYQNIFGTSTSTTARLLQISKPLSITSTATTSQTKSTTKTITATSAATTVLNSLKVLLRTMTAGASSVASFTKSTLKNLQATSTSAVSYIKQVYKTLTLSSTAATTFTKFLTKSITAASAATVTVTKNISKLITASSVAATQVVKTLYKSLVSTSTASANMSRLKVLLLTLSASSTALASYVRQVAKNVLASSAASSSISKLLNISLVLSIVSNATASVATAATRFRTLAVTSIASVTQTTLKVFLKLLDASSSATASLGRSISKIVSVTSTATTTFQKLLTKSMTVVSSVATTVQKVVVKTLSITSTAIGYLLAVPLGVVTVIRNIVNAVSKFAVLKNVTSTFTKTKNRDTTFTTKRNKDINF